MPMTRWLSVSRRPKRRWRRRRSDMNENQTPEKQADTPNPDREFFRNGGTAAARAAATKKLQQSVRDRDDDGAREAMRELGTLVREDAEGRKALKEWTDERREPGEQRDEEQARRDRNAGITPEMVEQEQEEQASEED